MLSDKTMEHICRLVDDSPPSTEDDLAALSTILGREPMNVAPQFPGRGWAIVFGFISIIGGYVVLAYPFDSIETLALVVGACLIVLGEVEVGSGVGMRRDVKKAESSVMSADWPVRAAPTITDKSIALQKQ